MKQILTRCLTLFAVFVLCIGAVSAAPTKLYEGVDVSVWQQEIDFHRVKDDGKEIVYIRAGEGMTEDLQFRSNAAKARESGIHFGFYFFVTAKSVSEAKQQAAYFAELIRSHPYDCRPAVDFEEFGNLTREEINAVALAFAEELTEQTRVIPLFYSDWNNVLHVWNAELSQYPLWVADYSATELSTLGPWERWAGFQYSDQGTVAGITGRVDLDRFTQEVFLPEPTPPQTGDEFPVVMLAVFFSAGLTAALIAVCMGKQKKRN